MVGHRRERRGAESVRTREQKWGLTRGNEEKQKMRRKRILSNAGGQMSKIVGEHYAGFLENKDRI